MPISDAVLTDGAGQLLSQGLLGVIIVFLLWYHNREITAVKAELKTERERGNALQESRLAETKEVVSVVQSNRTAMDALVGAIHNRGAS